MINCTELKGQAASASDHSNFAALSSLQSGVGTKLYSGNTSDSKALWPGSKLNHPSIGFGRDIPPLMKNIKM